MDTREFLKIVQMLIDKKIKLSFTLGKIDPAYISGNPKILFDGDAVVSDKRYPHLSSYNPTRNERVLLANVGGSHVVLGAIGAFKGSTSGGTTTVAGAGLDFIWQGTKLGVKRSDEAEYIFAELKGETGTAGTNGTNGSNGVGLQFLWSGTSLGVKREDAGSYTYTNLKGDKGDKGDTGAAGDSLVAGRETAWVQPTLSSGWVQYGGGYDHCKYKRDVSNMVHLKGMIKTGTVGTLFTLPEGFRPPTTVICIAHCRGLNTAPQNVEIRITNLGVVSIQNIPDNNWLSLHGVYFSTEL